MLRRGARSFGIALFFILSDCKKQEPVLQVAPTETGTIASPAVASVSVSASAPEPIASESSTPITSAASRQQAPERLLTGEIDHTPSLRFETPTVTGKLPAEVVRRVARRQVAALRECYENGLRRNPHLQGRVTTKYIIGRDGSVVSAKDEGSTLADATVIQCVGHVFLKLSHPPPEDGTVTVVFPLLFTPNE